MIYGASAGLRVRAGLYLVGTEVENLRQHSLHSPRTFSGMYSMVGAPRLISPVQIEEAGQAGEDRLIEFLNISVVAVPHSKLFSSAPKTLHGDLGCSIPHPLTSHIEPASSTAQRQDCIGSR